MTASGKPRVGCGDKSETMSTPAAIAKKKRIARTVRAWKARIKQFSNNAITIATPPATEMRRMKRKEMHLHHDLIMEQILTKLPVKHLLRCGAVSKSWYNSIHNDKRLTDSHFLQSQKEPNLLFSLLNVKNCRTGKVKVGSYFFKLASSPYAFHRDIMDFQRCRGNPVQLDSMELVGYCNGLPCISSSRGNYKPVYAILQIYRNEMLYINCAPFNRQAHIICHGFGFDSFANVYKLVSVYRTSQKELNFIVYTLGTKSWRDVTAVSTPVSVHGLPITRMRTATGKDRQAIFCRNIGSGPSGCLVWKITVGGGERGANNNNNNDNEMEMLLLFNLHDEKFQFIPFQTKGTNGEEQKQLVVDYPHLLEFRGYPCIARIEKLSGNNGSDCYNPLRHDRHGSGSCCCCCKVHLFVFKEQVWVKEASYDVCVKPFNRHHSWYTYSCETPDPCCFCFGSTTTPPTRICTFSDQIFLYWFDGRYLQVFDLRSKRLRLVSPSSGSDEVVFKAKMNEPSHTFDDDGDGNIYCSSMDYQLHCQGENFLSLQSFVPEGVGVNEIQLLK